MTVLDALLDTLLPGDGDFPPASAAALAAALAAHPRFAATLAPVLALLPADFAGQAPAARTAAVRAVEAAAPQAMAALLTGAYSLYYTHPAVAAAVERTTGHAARPPQPGGHELRPFDPAMVALPAGRARRYRPTPEDSP